MAWISPCFSKSKVGKAGQILVAGPDDLSAYTEARDVLSNWRASHAYPMHAMLMHLRDKSSAIDTKAIVVQRLKRSPSIIAKLQRYPSMKLSTMQDIGGCRSVVATARRVERLAESMVSSRTVHILQKVNDYVKAPKESGYRGIHLVYRYNASKEQFKGHLVELQLRSRIQHAWATAVEIVGNFTRQALKASIGDEDWLLFFQMVAAEFAVFEKRPVGDHVGNVNTREKVVELEARLNAFQRLNAFRFSTKFIEEKRKTKQDYFLLEVDYDKQEILTIRYAPGDLAQATTEYGEREKETAGNSSIDVVLVSGESIAGIQAAYPNYFADAKDFVGYVIEASYAD